MTARKPPRRTRERILAASLALFNRDGEPNVAVAHIAGEVSISPGNLHYHFRSKDAIVAELFTAFERESRAFLADPADAIVDAEDLWLLLHLMFERMSAYRFLFRDLADLAARHPRAATRLARLLREIEDVLAALCRGMIAGGRMQASEREVAALVRNALVVATFSAPYERAVTPRDVAADDDPGRAASRVLALFAPYLAGDARALIDRLARDYL